MENEPDNVHTYFISMNAASRLIQCAEFIVVVVVCLYVDKVEKNLTLILKHCKKKYKRIR